MNLNPVGEYLIAVASRLARIVAIIVLLVLYAETE